MPTDQTPSCRFLEAGTNNVSFSIECKVNNMLCKYTITEYIVYCITDPTVSHTSKTQKYVRSEHCASPSYPLRKDLFASRPPWAMWLHFPMDGLTWPVLRDWCCYYWGCWGGVGPVVGGWLRGRMRAGSPANGKRWCGEEDRRGCRGPGRKRAPNSPAACGTPVPGAEGGKAPLRRADRRWGTETWSNAWQKRVVVKVLWYIESYC